MQYPIIPIYIPKLLIDIVKGDKYFKSETA